ncbi:MAG: PIN domain-containing protein [Pseudomonadota bacterium]|nr:PIN domain-containing protein [Pseudomonadota bacterium]
MGKRGLPIHWSASIEAEFLDVWNRLFPFVADNGPRVLDLMRRAVPDWRAPESRRVLKDAKLPDPKDRHVLAAAVGVAANVIVTNNLKDFPADILDRYEIVARSPDDVLCAIFDEDQEAFIAAAAVMRARMKNPPLTVGEWLKGVKAGRCEQLSAKLGAVSRRL